MKPVLLVIGGPNGSGKTTVTARLREERWSEGVEYLNPDEVARDRFGDWNSPQAVLSAAQWTDARREELLGLGEGIAFETVLSTTTKVDFLRRAKDRGYFVRVFFIGTSDPRINAARIAGRVMEGGHTVPIEKIVTRYVRSMANLSAVLRLSDRVYVFDNSIDDEEARLCARTVDGQLRKIYGELPEWVSDAVSTVERHPQFVDLRAA
ncbi:MAG: zeta toxin family protein [Deltaproteobacteria bacterium]|nr:zeta toxin family protein [Deltaproteobacteria bacterium]